MLSRAILSLFVYSKPGVLLCSHLESCVTSFIYPPLQRRAARLHQHAVAQSTSSTFAATVEVAAAVVEPAPLWASGRTPSGATMGPVDVASRPTRASCHAARARRVTPRPTRPPVALRPTCTGDRDRGPPSARLDRDVSGPVLLSCFFRTGYHGKTLETHSWYAASHSAIHVVDVSQAAIS